MEKKILDILKDVFQLNSIDENCSQKTCDAWDSMGQLNLVAELEDQFDITLEPEDIGRMKCYKDVVELVKSKIG